MAKNLSAGVLLDFYGELLSEHRRKIYEASLFEDYKFTGASVEELANHINECYAEEGVTAHELTSYKEHDVYNEDLFKNIYKKRRLFFF